MPKATFGIRPHIPRTPEQAEEARQAHLNTELTPEAVRDIKENI
jgi:hypothetical protein